MPKTRRWTKLFKKSKKKKVNVCAELYPCWNEYLIEDLKAMPCRKTEKFTRKIRYHEDKVHSKDYDVFKCLGKEPDGTCDDGYTTCEDESDLARYEEYYLKNSKDLNKFKEDLAEEIVKYFLLKAGQVVTEKEKESYSKIGIRMLERLRDHSLDLEDIDLFNIISNITKNALNEPRLLILSENFKPEKKKSHVNSLANNVTRSVKRERTSKKSSNSSSSKKKGRARRRSYSNAVK